MAAALAWAGQAPDYNVNSRYTVESVEVSPETARAKMSRALREELDKVAGQKFDPASLERLRWRIRSELRAPSVIQKVAKGAQREQVKVIFEIVRRRTGADMNVPKFIYHSKQGWTGSVEVSNSAGRNRFNVGVLSDGDSLVERQAGIVARYEREAIGTDRVRLGFDFESYHQQWNRATLTALETDRNVPGIYRTRQNFAPRVTVSLADPLTLSVGVSFNRFQTQFPAARTEAANAVVTTLRFARRWEGASDRHDLAAGYNLRAATRVLDSDLVYARHQVDAEYKFRRGRQTVLARFAAGGLTGRAPLFERFVLGNASTLRGWNKWDLAPLGGDRMAHGTLEYRYRAWQVFYDTGSVRDHRREADVKHSLGVGLRAGDFTLAVAFPVKEGRAEPIFYVGMTF